MRDCLSKTSLGICSKGLHDACDSRQLATSLSWRTATTMRQCCWIAAPYLRALLGWWSTSSSSTILQMILPPRRVFLFWRGNYWNVKNEWKLKSVKSWSKSYHNPTAQVLITASSGKESRFYLDILVNFETCENVTQDKEESSLAQITVIWFNYSTHLSIPCRPFKIQINLFSLFKTLIILANVMPHYIHLQSACFDAPLFLALRSLSFARNCNEWTPFVAWALSNSWKWFLCQVEVWLFVAVANTSQNPKSHQNSSFCIIKDQKPTSMLLRTATRPSSLGLVVQG